MKTAELCVSVKPVKRIEGYRLHLTVNIALN